MNEKIKQLLTQYDDELSKMRVKPRIVKDYCGDIGVKGLQDDMNQMAHLRYMMSQMLDDEETEWSDTKTNRWLGFVQGVLWCNKLRGILELRDESRNLYEE